jgi:hypothetical protein
VRAILRRHGYLILRSWTRIVSMMYYPTVTMVIWGFLTLYLAPTNNFLRDAPGFFIGAVLLWDLLFRGQLGVSLTFIEEFYARNLGNLFVSPLTLPEYIAGQLTISLFRSLIGVGGACLFAYLVFGYSIFSIGLPLAAFFANLVVFGWGDRTRDVGGDPASRHGCRRARVGSGVHHRADLGRLLSDRRASGVDAGDRVGDSVVSRVRGDALGADPGRLPLGPLLGGVRAQRRLSRAGRRGVRVVDAQRARARCAAADGRVSERGETEGRAQARRARPRTSEEGRRRDRDAAERVMEASV